MGGEGTTMAMITSLKNNRNLLRKKTPFEQRSRYLKKYNLKISDRKLYTSEQQEAIRYRIKSQLKKEMMITIVAFITVAIVSIVLIICLL